MNLEHHKIKSGEVFFGSVKMEKAPTWDEEINYLDAYPEDLIDANSKKFRMFLKSCLPNSGGKQLYPWSKELALDMCEKFRKNHITLIKFYGFGKDSDSYPWHKDKMDVLLVQALGTVELKIENTAYTDKGRIFRPGHAVWIPRGTHHQVVASGSRLTYSYGVEGEPNPTTYI